MRLVVEGKHYDVSEYNKVVQECVLSAEDAALSDAEKLALAKSMLLDEEYRYDKSKIDAKINNSIEIIINHIHYAQFGSAEKLKSTLRFQMVLLSLLFIMSVLIFLMIMLLVIKPLNMYMECVKAGKPLKMSKAYEFNYLARTYNNIYKLNEENKNLQYTAEHDGLTGVFNRGAFDDLSELIKNK